MSQACAANRRRPLSRAVTGCEMVVLAPFILLSTMFIVLMLPITILAVPAQLIVNAHTDDYCRFVARLLVFAAINAVVVPAAVAYAFWQ